MANSGDSETSGLRGARATDGPALNLIEVLNLAEEFLRQRGCPAPRLDAQLLLAHVLGCDRVRLYLDHAKPLSAQERSAYREFVRRRAGREPVAYLLGQREFWSLSFQVDRRVLIPRPDSETLIEEALALFADRAPGLFADIGTGSGCLAGALAHAFGQARGVAVDVDPSALAVAAANLQALGLAARVEVRLGHLAEPLLAESFDLVCANLPYVPSDQLAGLDPDVNRYEPLGALDGGPDGLALVRALIGQIPERLAPGGWLLLEVGQGQAGEVSELCRTAGLGELHTRKDLARVERVVAAQRVLGPTSPAGVSG